MLGNIVRERSSNRVLQEHFVGLKALPVHRFNLRRIEVHRDDTEREQYAKDDVEQGHAIRYGQLQLQKTVLRRGRGGTLVPSEPILGLWTGEALGAAGTSDRYGSTQSACDFGLA